LFRRATLLRETQEEEEGEEGGGRRRKEDDLQIGREHMKEVGLGFWGRGRMRLRLIKSGRITLAGGE
jgi:hypothetical protein